jgi:hypothetical protein
MASDSGTLLSKKLGIKEGMKIAALNSPVAYEDLLGGVPARANQTTRLRGKVDFIHFFTESQSELRRSFPRLKKCLAENGILWISWPKGRSKLATDLNENYVRDTGLQAGLVDVKVCAVDEIWSGLKFVYRLKDRKK